MAPTILAEFSRHDVEQLETPTVALITDTQHLSSYNWVETRVPTITVPGSPPLWSPPRVPRRLKKDSGLVYIAQNAARHPTSPLEPLFRALYLTDPLFNIRSIDVITDRNNIRKLLTFVNPSSGKNRLETFTINVEVSKETAIFCRHETATHEIIGPHEFRGYGHEFEKAYTSNEISASTGHHRIISYRFGDLAFLVRHETDGYIHMDGTSPRGQHVDNDQLAGLLDSLSLSSASSPPIIAPSGSELIVKEGGQVVPLESTLEIKTRVSHKPLSFQEIAPQLWVSQTPKLVRAYHVKGLFHEAKVEDVAGELKKWEQDNQKHLRRLAALIKEIIRRVKECGGKAVVGYDDRKDKLVLSQVDGKQMLPEDLYAKWADVESEGSTASNEGAEMKTPRVDVVEVRALGKRLEAVEVGEA